jgi:phenazine biosynthesis protein phzE
VKDLLFSDRPFALIRREGAASVDVFVGSVVEVPTTADIPLSPGGATLALLPHRQIAERGFEVHDDGAPLLCLVASERHDLPVHEVIAALPDVDAGEDADLEDLGFDVDDETYGAIVSRVLSEEIGRGEGSNFVIHRTRRARTPNARHTALSCLRRLLAEETGAYWTFLVHTGDRTFVGASPERHVSLVGERSPGRRSPGRRSPERRSPERRSRRDARSSVSRDARSSVSPAARSSVSETPGVQADGQVLMNPISGTYRHPAGGADRDGLLAFLADPKEIDELAMVLDEELKMMAVVADGGGQVVGPYLKEMAHLAHTEYLLVGRSSLDPRDILRESMFAPTVTGSPIENACRVIARHEGRGRGYYGGVLALLDHDPAGDVRLDSTILIRTALVQNDLVQVSVGATLVRDSSPASEVAETHAKAAGVLSALGLIRRPTPAAAPPVRLADDPDVVALLNRRNERLSPFWLADRRSAGTARPFAGRTCLIVDAEDTFTGMLAHLLRSLGMRVALTPAVGGVALTSTVGRAGERVQGPASSLRAPGDAYDLVAGPGPGDYDLVVAGPGPGDPTDDSVDRVTALRNVIRQRRALGMPLLAVCLGHQVLARELGLVLHRRAAPAQGLAVDIDLFGTVRRVGYYSTFTALQSDVDGVEFATDPVGFVHAMRGPGFAGVQFHPESVLTEDGPGILTELIGALLPAAFATA